MEIKVNGAAGQRQNKYRTFAFAAVLLVCLAVLTVFAVKIDKGEGFSRKKTISNYSMVLQHYSGFDTSNTFVEIRTDWTERTVDLKDGEAKLSLRAAVYPLNIKNEEFAFSSDNTDVAEIDDEGNITAKNPGEAKILVTADGDYQLEKEVTLTVRQPATGIFMPKTNVTIYMGSTGELLEYRILPDNATNQNVKWESKDDKIAAVDENGHVKPVALGMTEVTAESEDGGFKAKCYVTVVNQIVNVSGVVIENQYKEDAFLKAGEGINLVAAVSPANARNKTLRWSTTDEKIATVTQTGKVRALSEGKVQISVASVNGISDVFNLTVQPSSDIKTDSSGNIYTSAVNGKVTYSVYDISLEDIVNIQMKADPPPKYNGATQYASREQTEEWMNPNSYCTGAYKYQFLDLSYPNGISEEALNSFLSDKGVLRGHAADFIAAARMYNVSEVYLVAHACLETGNGTSKLSRGVSVNGQTVYNVFGIGAYDNSAVASGSQRAYEKGWTSVSSAIIGGTEWISEHYINSADGRQNTLYKMLWNPENPGQHQYATDIEWATHQAINIEKIFRMFPQAVKAYDVPVYSGMVPPAIDTED